MNIPSLLRTILRPVAIFALMLLPKSVTAKTIVAADTLSASEAFVRLPAKTLDLLSTSMRLDMLDYYNRRDSIVDVQNAMEGLSHLVRPVTHEWLQAEITPVTLLTVRVLPYKKHQLIMTLYTVGDSLQAHDTEIRFYDDNMRELQQDKFIKTLSSKDFFNFEGVDGKLRKQLLDLVPFPTVEYSMEEGTSTLKAKLTVGEFLGKETLEKISPYLRREREFAWDGSAFKLVK